jgi:signal transduction histidine kinase/DNA-binding response OmpR family regulator
LPDLLATASLITLAIYHQMIYWGRKRDVLEHYNLYFSGFVLSAACFILLPYVQPQHFLYFLKPDWLYVLNIEAFLVLCLFLSGIKFLTLLLKVPATLTRYLYFTFITIPLNFLLTLTCNFISPEFYFENILIIVLVIVIINTILIYGVFGAWVYRQKLYRENFYRILYAGFILLTANILIYRTIELLTIPNILVFNHYISAFILYIFAYALSVKFNKEYFELKELKVGLEKKVAERTEALAESNQVLAHQNLEIENQRQEIISINRELSLRAEELSDLNQARSRFFAGISHEFRTPLTLIIGPLEGLLSNVPEGKTRSDYQLMLRQAKRLQELINQLLELSKLQKGMQRLNVMKGDLSRFVRTLVTAHEPLAKELDVELSFIEEGFPLTTWFDEDNIEKITTNLLTNALKFTNARGKVKIYLRLTSDLTFVELIVQDDGIGIEEEELKHIFDPFYQGEMLPGNSHLAGSGIGLSLVKELTELHHGTIDVISVPGKGSEFTVKIPADQSSYSMDEIMDPEPEDEIHPDTLQSSAGNHHSLARERKVILIAEDNTDMRSFIKEGLQRSYQIIEASNGKEGLEMAMETIPDLIIADVMMPAMDGLEMTRNLKQDERTSHIPVIILTAKASTQSKLDGLSTYADDYVTKPFNSKELALRIQNLMNIRDGLREKFSKCITVKPSELVTTSVDEKFLQKALQIVETNMSDSDFSTEQFCAEIFMSRAHVHRKLKALTGQSASHFIRSIRLKRAAQLLIHNTATVSEVAYQTGFNNLSFFTRCFKEQYGTLPSSYVVAKQEPT